MWKKKGEERMGESPKGNLTKNPSLGKREIHELINIASQLYIAGFNIVPVSGKAPIGSWSPEKRIKLEELKKRIKGATGLAITGGKFYPGAPNLVLVIVDVDRPSALDKCPKLKEFIEKTVRWKSGPRCPKCEGKELEIIERGVRFKCKNCGVEFNMEEAKRGLGALFLATPQEIKGTERYGDIELLVNNYALIPPSEHPSGVKYEWIKGFDPSDNNWGVFYLLPVESYKILEELRKLKIPEEKLAPTEKASEALGLRELNENEKSEIVELLRDAYMPGNRHFIALYLSGWAAKSKISPISIAEIIARLHETCKDEDPLENRLGCIVYSYKKEGINVDAYSEEFERRFRVRPYGLGKAIVEEAVKGKSGLQEILEERLGEERAIEGIRVIEEIFGALSPWHDSIIAPLDLEQGYYAVANYRKLKIYRARRYGDEGKLRAKEIVALGVPIGVIVYENPLDGSIKIQSKWLAQGREKPLETPPVDQDILMKILKSTFIVTNSRLAPDVITAILNMMITKGRVQKVRAFEGEGFYLQDGELRAYNVELKNPSKDELKKALEFLNELATIHYSHAIAKFAETIRWFIIAPFSFAYKQNGIYPEGIMLYEQPGAGKTTLAEIGLSIWGKNNPIHARGGGHVDTPARLGEALGFSTFPIVINEAQYIFKKPEMVDLIKDSLTSTTVRSRIEAGAYKTKPALANICFTANTDCPRDGAFLRRCRVILFTPSNIISEEKRKIFEISVKPKFPILRHLGDFIAAYILEHGLNPDYKTYSKEILRKAFEYVGLEPPNWIELEEKEEIGTVSEFYETLREQVRIFLADQFERAYFSKVGKIEAEMPGGGTAELKRTTAKARERVNIVIEEKFIPWVIKHGKLVCFTTGLLEEIRGKIGSIDSLKSLAELMGWEYGLVKMGENVKRVVKVEIEKFEEFLYPPIEDGPSIEDENEGSKTESNR
jgi:predicted RNA-binding Zn-ribbon protein involved in translation (DUF1610 family)